MFSRPLIVTAALLLLGGWRDRVPEWPVSGPMPDAPGHGAPSRYDPITGGTRSYRPVEPMPWGDVNRRVAPPEGAPPSGPAKPDEQSTPAPTEGTPDEPAGHEGH